MNYRDVILSMWNEISKLIDEKLSNQNKEKSFKATVWKINDDNTYRINYLKELYDVPNATNIPISIGQTVWIKIPNGILREMFIYGVVKGKKASSSSTTEELVTLINNLQKKVDSNTSQINDITLQLDSYISTTKDSNYEPLEN